uniref:Uncharacterized protein n=1 Tax=Siphoviridae sp. ctF2K4 TaxID=2825401 RepID=A0A8S5VFF6_9CAUD|nr:MAG TPA: hypothetical protein [Siphoviridae sp. ctF2K4]
MYRQTFQVLPFGAVSYSYHLRNIVHYVTAIHYNIGSSSH